MHGLQSKISAPCILSMFFYFRSASGFINPWAFSMEGFYYRVKYVILPKVFFLCFACSLPNKSE